MVFIESYKSVKIVNYHLGGKMKKIIPLIFAIIIFNIAFVHNNIQLKDYAISYIVTLNGACDDINYEVINNGALCHISTSAKNYNHIQENYGSSILSETFVFEVKDLENILNSLKFEEYKCYMVDDIKVIEGYSNFLKKYIIKYNCKFNLQIAISDEVKIGYPYIAEGF